ncbi:AMIN-like domain-containing (lipo)protein (plasmid) [Rhodococcus ruber]
MKKALVMAVAGLVGAGALGGCGQEASEPDDLGATASTRSGIRYPATQTGTLAVDPTPTPTAPTFRLNPPPGAPAPEIDVFAPTATVEEVTIESDRGVDRVVYTFTGHGAPTWKVGYVAEALPRSSSAPLAITAAGILQVDITGTAVSFNTPALRYGPSNPLTPPSKASAVEQVYLIPSTGGDGPIHAAHGGITQSFIGVRDRPLPFRVSVLQDPPRLVVTME